MASVLEKHWIGACRYYEVPKDVTEQWWKYVQTRYTESQRAYHTLEHLREMFGYFDHDKAKLRSPHLVAFSIFFHDIIYNPKNGAPRNEEEVEPVPCASYAKNQISVRYPT